MKKTLKIILSIISSLIIFIVMLPIVLAMLLQVGFVQQFAVDKVTAMLSEKAGTVFSISHVEIGLFNKAIFDDVYIEGPTGDTMIYVKSLKAAINGINFFTGNIALGAVTVSDGQVNLYKDSLDMMNVKQVFDHFKPKVPNPNPPNFRMSCTQLNAINMELRLDDYTVERQAWGVNFKNMYVSAINFQGTNIDIFNYDIHLSIAHLSLREKSGFALRHLSSSRCGVNGTGMRYENLRLETPHSLLRMEHFNLLYASWWDYNDFVNKVTLDAELRKSRISMRTINYFMKQRLDISTELEIDGRVVGAIPRLSGELTSVDVEGTSLAGSFAITGLPNIKQTNFAFHISRLSTNARSINSIVEQVTHKKLSLGINKILENSGAIGLTGTFDGLLSEFGTDCRVVTERGVLDAKLKVTPRVDASRFVGSVSTTDFELGQALGAKGVGQLTIDAKVDALLSEKSMALTTSAAINRLGWNGYDYSHIKMDGYFNDKVFDGIVSSTDSNFNFITRGVFDFSAKEPDYNFEMTLHRANLNRMNINRRDSISLLSAKFAAHFSGTTIDNINGTAEIDSILYINQLDTVHTGAIYIESYNSEQDKQLTLNSDFADIMLRGRNSYSNIFGYLTKMAATYIPSIPEATEIVTGTKAEVIRQVPAEQTFDDGYYTLKVDVKKANNVAAIFLPGLEVAQGTKLNFFFNPHQNKFSITLNSQYIQRDNFLVTDLQLDSRNVADSLSLLITAGELDMGNFYMPNLSVIGGIKENRISLGARYQYDDLSNGALVNTTTHIYRTASGMPQISVDIHPSRFTLNKNRWMIPHSRVLLDTTGVTLNNLTLRSSEGNLSLNGRAGRNAADTMYLNMSNFDLSPASALVSGLGYDIKGKADGRVEVVSLFKDMRFLASVDFRDLYFGGYSLGNAALRSKLNQQATRIMFSLTIPDGTNPATGYYDIKKRTYGAHAVFPNFDMVLLQPLLQGILVDTHGSAAVDLTLQGGKNTPTLNGTVKVNKYSVKVDYTKVRYELAGLVEVKNNRFQLLPTKVKDTEGRQGDIEGFFDSKYFKELSFGVDVRFQNLLCLNTTSGDNESFYGKAYGSGMFHVGGTERNTNINIVAQTAPGSTFVMPISSISTIQDASFIKYVDLDNPTQQETKRRQPLSLAPKKRDKIASELDIKIDLSVLPNTDAKIIYDNSVMSNIINGRGTGRLAMHINPSQEIFTINGPVEISKGSYRFVATIFDKWLTLQPGGYITWTGSPSNPTVHFTGIYKVKASLEPITGSIGGGGGGTTPIDCGITLTGELFSPTIDLSITAPTATPETQNLLRNALNTQEQVTMQFFSLFAAGTFMPDMSAAGIGTMSGSLAGATGFEFLSNQISNLISSEKYNIRFGYKPRSETSSDEFNVDFSTDIIGGVLSLELAGTYNTGNNPTANINQRSPFSGDAYLTLSLNKANTLKLKGFTRVIDRFDETQGLQESGVGVYFRQDFQSWEDLKRRYRQYIQKLRQQKKDRQNKKNK